MHDRQPPDVRVVEFDEGKIMEASGLTVSAFLVEHDPVKPAFGFRFDGGGRSIAVSGDTRPCENLMRASYKVDLLVHECCEMAQTSWYPDCGWATKEDKIRDLASYHTQPEDLGRVAAEACARMLAVTHLMPGSDGNELKRIAARTYPGPIVISEDLLSV